jgi:excinuclease ABC subunit C
MVELATRVDFRPTDSVLEALILESALIKKHQPEYNTLEKDDSSYAYVVITKEEYPRVLLLRGKDLATPDPKLKIDTTFGPFPHARELRTALKLVRKIFPFRDNCTPESGKPCFNAQIGLCPGVCAGTMSASEYKQLIRHIKMFFAGKKKQLLRDLEKKMKRYAELQEFEKAAMLRRQLFALQHIQDVALIKDENINTETSTGPGQRIEAYDVAHTSGQNSVGVMVVLTGGELNPSQYRKFKLRQEHKGNDLAALAEILERRSNHPEWPSPTLVVIDGGQTQLNLAKKTLANLGWQVPIVSVVKDDKHRARGVLGDQELAKKYEFEIVRINAEAHRFAIAYHRQRRDRLV